MSSPSLFPIYSAAKLKKKYGAKLIVEIRDLWPLTLIELGKISSGHPFVKLLQRMEKLMYRHADRVVSVLPIAHSHMEAHGMSSEKFAYIPNGVVMEEESVELSDDFLRDLSANKFVVGYAGSIGLANALEFLIEAARKLSANTHIHFVLVGKGAEVERLKERAAGLTNISFLDAVEKKQVQSLLQYFNLCYIGWRNEDLYRFGISANKLFEYMLSGKPVLHSTNAGNDPISEAKAGVSVPAEEVDGIIAGIQEIYNLSEVDRKEMGARGEEVCSREPQLHQVSRSVSGIIVMRLFK